MSIIRLKPGRQKLARKHHPWVFSGAIAAVEGKPQPGDVVTVQDANGMFVAHGYYNRKSQIAVRLLDWDESQVIDEAWWRARIKEAVGRRNTLLEQVETDAYRLVHAEADFLPGLIVDKYADFVVVQALTAGVERVKAIIVDELVSLVQPAGIYERSDPSVREMEGLAPAAATRFGEAPPDTVEIKENNLRFLVDLKAGQKTGFFLDQRENRKVAAGLVEGRHVLDCFCYTGGFSVYARAAGAASVTSADTSESALVLLRKNFEINEIPFEESDLVKDDVSHLLRHYRDTGRKFDLVILDPPKLAPNKVHLEKAQRAYKDMNLLAMKILNPNGILLTFSCSGAVTPERFQQVVAWATVDAGREVQITGHLSQAPDHPIRLSFPESHYLKGLVCRVI